MLRVLRKIMLSIRFYCLRDTLLADFSDVAIELARYKSYRNNVCLGQAKTRVSCGKCRSCL